MKRHFYISDDLDDLEIIEHQLEGAGVITPQIHVLSEDDAGIKAHRLNDVEAVLRKDVVHGTYNAGDDTRMSRDTATEGTFK